MDVLLTKDADKYYHTLRQSDQKKVDKKIDLLKSQPTSGKKLGGEFEGLRSLKSWPYRIFYYTDDKRKAIIITSILHRQGAYK